MQKRMASAMTAFERHLSAASGYLELGLPIEANEELDQIEPKMRLLSDVLALWVGIYQTLGAWELMEAIARRLSELRPGEPQWFITLGYAIRRCTGLQEALAVMAHASNRFPNDPIILYNLACYAAQLGHLHAARGRIKEAIALAPECREMALKDDDPKSLWSELSAG